MNCLKLMWSSFTNVHIIYYSDVSVPLLVWLLSIPIMVEWPFFLFLPLFTALSWMFHAWFHDNRMISENLDVSMFCSVLRDLVSNLRVNLDFLSVHSITASTMPCSGQDILGGDAWMNIMDSMLSRSLHTRSLRWSQTMHSLHAQGTQKLWALLMGNVYLNGLFHGGERDLHNFPGQFKFAQCWMYLTVVDEIIYLIIG